MNKEMVFGTVRHFLTIVSGAVLAGNTTSLQTAIPDLFNKIAQGDSATIASAIVIVGALLWSMWVKASEETKTNIVVKMKTIGRVANVNMLVGKPTVVIFGNLKTCSYCRTFWGLIGSSNPASDAKLAALIPGATIINADAGSDAALYASWKAKANFSGNYPGVVVFDSNGIIRGRFVGRASVVTPFTVAEVAKRIIALCPDCCTGGCEEGTTLAPTTTKSPVTTTKSPIIPANEFKCIKCGFIESYCPNCGTKRA